MKSKKILQAAFAGAVSMAMVCGVAQAAKVKCEITKDGKAEVKEVATKKECDDLKGKVVN